MVSYSEVVRHTLGRPGQLFVELLLIMSQMGRLLAPASFMTCRAVGLQRVVAALSPWPSIWQSWRPSSDLQLSRQPYIQAPKRLAHAMS